jgi:hypothetical protein
MLQDMIMTEVKSKVVRSKATASYELFKEWLKN